jgi:hypothetical protein
MQIRHIRPGSLEWQESKADEVDQGVERLTPEEMVHLRELSDNRLVAKNREDHDTAEL